MNSRTSITEQLLRKPERGDVNRRIGVSRPSIIRLERLRCVEAFALTPGGAAPRVVHDRPLGYRFDPGDVYESSSGTSLVPFPLNLDVPPSEFRYFTWRDTVEEIPGARFYQVRLTFVSNAASGQSPKLYAFGMTWSQ